MPFEPGQSGNPEGRAVDKPWREALRLAAHEVDPKSKTKKIRKIAQAVVDAAMGGDLVAAKEIGDRLDGKAPQGVQLSGDKESPVELVFRWKS